MTKNETDATRRIPAGWASFNRFKDFFVRRKIDMKWKRRLFNACVVPALTYGAETWAFTKGTMERLTKAQRRMERRMVGVTLRDRKTNEWLRGVTKVKNVKEEALKKKWKWAQKVMRKPTYSWARRTTEWRPRGPRRPRGRPATRWRDIFEKEAGKKWWRTAREDAETWKNLLVNSL